MKYQFKTSADLLKLAAKYKMPISEIAINYEIETFKKNRKEIIEKMARNLMIMREAVKKGVNTNKKSFTGMSGGNAKKMYQFYESRKQKLLNKTALVAMSYAMATGEMNAAMGRIVAFPTAGGAGTVPAGILSVAEGLRLSDNKIFAGLFTASAIGMIIAENATLAGAEGGCQAEVGSSAAMAAAGITEMRGGNSAQCLNAAALALKNMLGLTCDPLGGLVEVPCIKRNAVGVITAISASEMAMAGIETFVPFDEIVKAMKNIGNLMAAELKETALGGLAITPTGCKIRKKIGLPPIKSL
ncbi:L-serine ammonia-lyase, iron-sulfur-dependent, subunit alpha [Candidatus Peregrinibacteria bacterium]|nr:L-serine ammonia-lyase, iron-sulfur-dependent, subunit alpha [Candidatus Peregrinibacteria bacterium]